MYIQYMLCPKQEFITEPAKPKMNPIYTSSVDTPAFQCWWLCRHHFTELPCCLEELKNHVVFRMAFWDSSFGVPTSDPKSAAHPMISCGIFNSNKTSKPCCCFFQGVPKEILHPLLMKFRRCSHVVHVVLPPIWWGVCWSHTNKKVAKKNGMAQSLGPSWAKLCHPKTPAARGNRRGVLSCLNLGCPNIEIRGHHLPNMRPPFPHDFVGEERRLIFLKHCHTNLRK